MTDSSRTAEVMQLLSAAFPDIRCLRCGHDQFLVATDIDALVSGRGEGHLVLSLHNALASPTDVTGVMTLACERCGHLEQHLTGFLARAHHPIPDEARSDD